MSKEVNVNFGGGGTLLLCLFIGLKLTHYINWSWWWVLTPLWAPLAIFGVILVFVLLLAIIKALLE